MMSTQSGPAHDAHTCIRTVVLVTLALATQAWQVGGVPPPAPPAHPESPLNAERIAFTWTLSSRQARHQPCPGCSVLCVIHPDGSGLRQVTAALAHDAFPAWSPDGSRIVFESDRRLPSGDAAGTTHTLWVMNADGSELRPLLHKPGNDCGERPHSCRPQWSPDGTAIAFTASRHGETAFRVYRAAADGSGMVALTKGSDPPNLDERPVWSPDGKRIAWFHRDAIPQSFQYSPDSNVARWVTDGPWEIHVMNADGTNPRTVHAPGAEGGANSLSWSPDGLRLRFGSAKGFCEADLESGREGLLSDALGKRTRNQDIAWSPDGRRVAYVSGRAIETANTDGSGAKALTRPVGTPGVVAASELLIDIFNEILYHPPAERGDDELTWGPAWGRVRDPSAVARDRGRIAFAAMSPGRDSRGPGHDDANLDIYTMTPIGTDVRRLTDAGGADESPAWSPDHRRIAFVSSRDGNPEIYVMNANGSSQQRLTKNPTADSGPAWSPDGTLIAFASDHEGRRRIFVMSAEGRDVRRVTEGAGQDSQPAWSPDGRVLAFTSERDGETQIFSLHPDGTGLRRLSDGAGADREPAWSRDGAHLAFSSTRGGNRDIYVMDADGTGVRRVTNDPAEDRHPSWSPDGREISFATARFDSKRGLFSIAVESADGGVPMEIARSLGSEAPHWSSAEAAGPSRRRER